MPLASVAGAQEFVLPPCTCTVNKSHLAEKLHSLHATVASSNGLTWTVVACMDLSATGLHFTPLPFPAENGFSRPSRRIGKDIDMKTWHTAPNEGWCSPHTYVLTRAYTYLDGVRGGGGSLVRAQLRHSARLCQAVATSCQTKIATFLPVVPRGGVPPTPSVPRWGCAPGGKRNCG